MAQRRDRGIELFGQRKYPEALAEFESVLESDSTNVHVLYAAGVCQHNLKEYAEASTYLRRALAIDSTYVKARRVLGLALYERGRELLAAQRHESALRSLLEAAALDTANAKIVYHIGLAYAHTSQPAQAIEAYARAAELDTTYAAPHAALGRAFLGRGEYSRAIAHLERALAVGRRTPSILKDLAVAYEKVAHEHNQRADYPAAVQAALKSLEYNGTHIPSRVVLGEAYEGLGQTSKALEQYGMARADLMWRQYVQDKITRLTAKDEDQQGD